MLEVQRRERFGRVIKGFNAIFKMDFGFLLTFSGPFGKLLSYSPLGEMLPLGNDANIAATTSEIQALLLLFFKISSSLCMWICPWTVHTHMHTDPFLGTLYAELVPSAVIFLRACN